MATPLAVLIVEDSESDAQLIIRLLNKAGYEVAYQQVETAEQMRAAMEKQAWDIVISDYSLPNFDGPAALALLREKGLDIPFIVVSGTIGEETAVIMLKSGAHDYLVKGNLTRLVPAVERELAQAKERRQRKRMEEELRRSRELLNQSFGSLYDALFIIDAATSEILDCNPAACEMFGYERSEMVGQTTDLLHMDNNTHTEFRRRLRQSVEEKGFFYLPEYQIRRKDGTLFFTDQTVTPLRDAGGRITGWVSAIRDITERKQAEEAVRESESILRGFLEQSEDAIMLANEQGIVIQWSRGAEKLTGYSRAESIGKTLWDVQYRSAIDEFKSTEHYERIKASLQAALLSGQGTILNRLTEAALQRPDGMRLITQSLAFPIRTNKGFLVGSILRDITERKQAEAVTRRTTELLSEALNIARLANWEYDVEKDLFLFNDHFFSILHTTAEREGGYSMSSSEYAKRFVYPQDAPAVAAAIKRALASTDRHYNAQREHRILYRDGGMGQILAIIHIDRDEQGRIIRYYGVNQDITERKLAEEATKHTAELLSEAMDIARLANWEYDIEKDLFLFNDHFYAIFHTTAEQQGGYKMSSAQYAQRLVHPDDAAVVGAAIEKALASTERNYQTRLEHRILYADGGTGYISVSIHIDKDEQGRVVRYYGVNQDITELRRAAEMSRYLASIVEASDDAIIGKTLDGIITSWNSGAARLYGYSDKEAIGQAISLIIPPDRPNELTEILARLRRGESVEHYETIRLTKDGARLDVSLTVSPIKDASGQVVGASSIGRDITSRKQVEQALQASEERYRGLFEDSPISLWEEDFTAVKQRLDRLIEEGITDFKEYLSSHPKVVVELAASIKVVDVNKATMKMFGAHGKEELAKNLAELFIIGQNQEFLVEFVNVAEGKTSFGWDGINKTLDGRLINIGLWWSAAPGYEKSLSRVIISMIDITERKQAEAALAKSERDYRTLFENMPIGLYRTTTEGRILDANQTMVNMLGYKDRNTLLATNVKNLYLDPTSDQKFKTEIEKNDILPNFESEFKRPDGSVFWAEDHIRLIRNEAGEPLYYEGSIIDITERKQAVEALQQAKDFAEKVIQTANVIFIQLDPTGNIQKFNAAAEEITGYSLSEVMGTNWGDKLVPRERYPNVWLEFDQLTATGENTTSFENPILTKQGEERNILWKNNPLYEGDKIIGLISFGIDITERKRAEEALHESQQRYRALFEDTPVAIWEEDFSELKKYLDGLKQQGETDLRRYFKTHPEAFSECAVLIRYLDVNKAALKLYRADTKEELFKGTEQALSRGEQEHILEDFMAIAQGKTGNSWEGADETFAGESIEISLNWSVVPGYEHDYSKVIVTTVDISDRRRAEKRIREQLERLAALRTIDQVITASFDLHNSLTMILRQVTKELGVDAADVLLLNEANLFLEYNAGIGFRTRAAEKASVRMGQSYAGHVALERQIMQVLNLKNQPEDLPLNVQLASENFAAYVGVPLVAKGVLKGVLEVYHRAPLQPDQEWMDFLNTLAGQAALAIDNAQLFENLQRSNIDLTLAYDATIEGWSHAMDLRDKETEGHTLRVTEMTMELAGLFGIKDEDLVSIRRGTLLHDIGKMGVPDAILLKADALTDEEWVIMRKHPALAFEMLSSIRYLRSAIDIPYCHHEKWDGTGYPRGLSGEMIPLSARIFAIVDVWDALTSDRPYRKAWSKEKTIEHLKSQAGKHFDPEVLAICLESGVFDSK